MLRDLGALRWLDAGESVILYGPDSAKPMWHRSLGIMSPGVAGTCGSSNAPACSPISRAATPTGPSASACANTTRPLLLTLCGPWPGSAFAEQAEQYLRLRRLLGHRIDDAVRLLPRFVAYLDAAGASAITVEVALASGRKLISSGEPRDKGL